MITRDGPKPWSLRDSTIFPEAELPTDPLNASQLCYLEVEVVGLLPNKEQVLALGIAPSSDEMGGVGKRREGVLPGDGALGGSLGYRSDGMLKSSLLGDVSVEVAGFASKDKVGCGWRVSDGRTLFTLNGKVVGVDGAKLEEGKAYRPVVGASGPGPEVTLMTRFRRGFLPSERGTWLEAGAAFDPETLLRTDEAVTSVLKEISEQTGLDEEQLKDFLDWRGVPEDDTDPTDPEAYVEKVSQWVPGGRPVYRGLVISPASGS